MLVEERRLFARRSPAWTRRRSRPRSVRTTR